MLILTAIILGLLAYFLRPKYPHVSTVFWTLFGLNIVALFVVGYYVWFLMHVWGP
jgi:hypothetical protein